jgi:hypothetical protein
MTRPLRLMILHFSHMGFTDGLTFMVLPPYFAALLRAPGNSSAGQVIGRHLDRYLIAGKDADEIHAQLSGDMGKNLMSVADIHLKHGIRQCFNYGTFKLNYVVFSQAFLPPKLISIGLGRIRGQSPSDLTVQNSVARHELVGDSGVTFCDTPQMLSLFAFWTPNAPAFSVRDKRVVTVGADDEEVFPLIAASE